MGIASEEKQPEQKDQVMGALIEACWPPDIPRDYTEMQRMYGPYVASMLRRYNKVGRNFEELLSYVWLKLIEVDVIRMFMESVSAKLPVVMTAEEACRVLGVTFGQWRTKMYNYHIGDIERAADGSIMRRRKGGWMPTPVNKETYKPAKIQVETGAPAGYSSRKALFDTADIMMLAASEDLTKGGRLRGPFSKQGPQELPTLKATKGHFQAYVSKAIYRSVLNWCRTWRRKFAQDQPMYQSQEGGEYDTSEWDRLADDGAAPDVEATVNEAVSRLKASLRAAMPEEDAGKVEKAETMMLDLLQQGVPLPEVVKKMDVPDPVRRAVLRAVAEMRT